jgi:hypothetical protein
MGNPAAIASLITRPQGSKMLGKIKNPACLNREGKSE